MAGRDVFDAVQERIGHRFADAGLLRQALTHRSASDIHLERLEYLGDAVLDLAVAEALFTRFPELDEGSLSRIRASLVCRASLSEVAKRWRLELALRVGGGERGRHGGVKSGSIVADAVEALIGAVHLDGGWEAARRVVLEAWAPLLETVRAEDAVDAKSRLQEYTQGRAWGLPRYEVEDLGVDAAPRFLARCFVRDELAGSGRGERKKVAERRAAEEAWKKIATSEA